MDDMLAIGRSILASQPFSVLLGAELRAFSPGHAELTIAVTSELLQQHGFVHGGVISYLADNSISFAGGSVLGPSVLIAEFKINYLRPAKGTTLTARADVVHAGRTQAVCQSQVFAVNEGQEYLCAIALGTVVRAAVPAEGEIH